MRAAWLICSVVAAVSACGSATQQAAVHSPGVVATASPRSSATSPGPVDPGTRLRALARSRHATFVAGPKRGPAGLFGAYAVVRSVSAVRDPKNTLVVVRWSGGEWVRDGRLTAAHRHGFWDFPVNTLSAGLVDGASAEAPVFAGTEGGGGGYGLMVAVRQQGEWSWARFEGCPNPEACPPLVTRSYSAANARIVKGEVTGRLGNCRPSCAESSVVYVNHFRWVPAKGAFVLTDQEHR